MRRIVNQAIINAGAIVTWDNGSHFYPREIEFLTTKGSSIAFFIFKPEVKLTHILHCYRGQRSVCNIYLFRKSETSLIFFFSKPPL